MRDAVTTLPPLGEGQHMTNGRRGRAGWLVFVASLSFVLLTQTPVGGQKTGAHASSAKTSTVPRTPWGDPDFQGTWDFSTITPMQRSPELAGREFLTAAEVAELEQRAHSRRIESEARPRPGDVGNYNLGWWWEPNGRRWVPTRRASLIVDPADGRMPALTQEGEKRRKAREEAHQRLAGPEDLPPEERCLVGVNAGPPMIPGPYGNTVQFHQSPGYVVIVNEMVHHARVVPVDGRPHVSSAIRLQMGNSQGRWEGDTLVVETRNLRNLGNGHIGPTAVLDENLHLIERFTRQDDDTLMYEFTINDPTIFVRPWTAQIPMTKMDGFVLEYACHEGNYGMVNILAGARARERTAAAEREP